jgi:predicted helicase
MTKDDILFYVDRLLHRPGYRYRFATSEEDAAANPVGGQRDSVIDAGRALSELHLGYESAKPYSLDGLPDQNGEDPRTPTTRHTSSFGWTGCESASPPPDTSRPD